MKLPPQPWMDTPWLTAVFDALDAGTVRFVGGCVRDSLLSRPVKDIDLATDLLPDAVMAAATAAGLKAVPTGIDHGTVTVVSDHHPVEVTTLRKDVETDGRRAVVAFTADWREDALRRDLTFNALSMDRDGTVHDYFGGLEDAGAGRVRFVGDADLRIREDALRILRFFRFFAHYGRGDPDRAGVDACRRHAGLLEILSAERIWQELSRLLQAEDPMASADLMEGCGVWEALGIGPVDLEGLRHLTAAAPADTDPLLRLAALAGPGRDAADLAARLRLSNAERDRLRRIQLLTARPPHPEAYGATLYRHGGDLCAAAARLALARGGAADDWNPFLAAACRWTRRTFPIQGRDLLAAGLPAGPGIGRLLEQVEDWWIDGGFEPDRAACLEKALALSAEDG